MEAYQLYCQAAGVLDELRRRLLPALGPQCVSGDLSRELLTALHLYALGEAQVGRPWWILCWGHCRGGGRGANSTLPLVKAECGH
jgi:hypothetical protein